MKGARPNDAEPEHIKKIRVSMDEAHLRRLAKNANTSAKLAVLDNPVCPDDVVSLLCRDKEAAIAQKAQARIQSHMMWLEERKKMLEQKYSPLVAQLHAPSWDRPAPTPYHGTVETAEIQALIEGGRDRLLVLTIKGRDEPLLILSPSSQAVDRPDILQLEHEDQWSELVEAAKSEATLRVTWWELPRRQIVRLAIGSLYRPRPRHDTPESPTVIGWVSLQIPLGF
ncbi:MAG: hypothetical protein IPG68_07710 [Micrococcales bacterium]|nr:hypothetical protein [Micrococcales bacterium]